MLLTLCNRKNQGVKESYFGQSRFSFSFCLLCLRLVIHTSGNCNTCPSSVKQKINLKKEMRKQLILKQTTENTNEYVNCKSWHIEIKIQCFQEPLWFKYVNPIWIPHKYNDIQMAKPKSAYLVQVFSCAMERQIQAL